MHSPVHELAFGMPQRETGGYPYLLMVNTPRLGDAVLPASPSAAL